MHHPLTWIPERGVPVSKHGSMNEGNLGLYQFAFKMETVPPVYEEFGGARVPG